MDNPSTPLRIECVATGNELLDGSIWDAHTRRLGEVLSPLGLNIQRVTVVPDHPPTMTNAFLEAASRADVVITTGGLGPTSDDLSLEVAAKAFGASLRFDPEAKKNVLRRLRLLKRKKVAPGHRKQFYIPEGSRAIRNDEGTAPAVEWSRGNRTFFFLPGVPREFEFVLQTHLLPWFEKKAVKSGTHLFIGKSFGWPESELQVLISKIKIPSSVEVGYRTLLPENHLKFMVRARSRRDAEKILHPVKKKVESAMGAALWTWNDETLATVVVRELLKKRWRLVTAESCTGGLLASMIASVPGASKVFDGGIVAYANAAKVRHLRVSEKTLAKEGAVSERTAREMAQGILKETGADIAVSVTGIAGPGGGTKEKPVGTIWLACSTRKKVKTMKLSLPYNRHLNQMTTCYHALQFIREFL